MSWEDEIKELKSREALAFEMGGADKVARQHEFNKLTIRERIASISDAESFHEIGTLAGVGQYDAEGNLKGFTPSNFVFGTRRVLAYRIVFVGFIIVTSVVSLEAAVSLIDGSFALMAIPTVVSAILLAPKVTAAANTYWQTLEK